MYMYDIESDYVLWFSVDLHDSIDGLVTHFYNSVQRSKVNIQSYSSLFVVRKEQKKSQMKFKKAIKESRLKRRREKTQETNI